MSRRRMASILLAFLLLIAAALGLDRLTRSGDRAPIPAPPRPRSRVAAAPSPRLRASSVPEAPPIDPVEVRCEVGRALEGRSCQLVISLPPDNLSFTETSFTYDGSSVAFTPEPDSRVAVLRCPEVEGSVRFTWSSGTDGPLCEISGKLPPPADAPLSGRVDGAADLPEGTVFLEGCGAQVGDPVDADGSFFVQTAPGRCEMRAWRQAGALRLPGPWTEVTAIAGTDVEVSLSVPTFEPAGMGIGFRPQEEGIGVTAVRSGSPAELAGLLEGDLILRIDGIPTDGMDIESFLQAGIGPEGSRVRLEGTTSEGEPFDVTLTRRRIDPG